MNAPGSLQPSLDCKAILSKPAGTGRGGESECISHCTLSCLVRADRSERMKALTRARPQRLCIRVPSQDQQNLGAEPYFYSFGTLSPNPLQAAPESWS